jgi:Fe-S-cluster-containing hydrogenase component 2
LENIQKNHEQKTKNIRAIIECYEEIPCDPCEIACKSGAIIIGKSITNIPVLDEEKCTGCGLCIANCPGLAIFVVCENYTDTLGTVSLPFEILPLPKKGQKIRALNRNGQYVCKGEVVKAIEKESFDRTAVVTIAIPRDKVDEVRGIEIPKR